MPEVAQVWEADRDAAQVREAVREFAALYADAPVPPPPDVLDPDPLFAPDHGLVVVPDPAGGNAHESRATADHPGVSVAANAAAAAPPATGPRRGVAGLELVARFVSSVYAFVVVFLVLAVVIPALVAGWQPLSVVSGSMRPAVAPGSVVLIEPAEPDVFYAAPAIIAFADPARPGQLLTHRVVDTTEVAGGTVYTTKGDANAVADSDVVDHGDVVGTVRTVVPFVGLPATWVHDGALVALGTWLLLSVVAVGALFARARP